MSRDFAYKIFDDLCYFSEDRQDNLVTFNIEEFKECVDKIYGSVVDSELRELMLFKELQKMNQVSFSQNLK